MSAKRRRLQVDFWHPAMLEVVEHFSDAHHQYW
jgi:hypothetical protein